MSRRARLVALVGLVLAVLGAAPASAIPDVGAGPDTPGTSASVSPRTLRAGETIHFTLSGFPAGEVAYVKIDDGVFCSESGVHGACVVHQQRIGADGRVSGSFALPDDLEPGAHWLRFLASEEMTDAQGAYLGVKGYTRRGGADFTVVAGGSGSAGGTSGSSLGSSGATVGAQTAGQQAAGASTAGAAAATRSAGGTAVAAGEVLVVRPAEADRAARAAAPPTTPLTTPPTTEPAPTAVPAPTDEPSADAVTDSTEAPGLSHAAAEEARFPLVGTLGLVLLLGLAAGLVLRARRTRG